MNIFLSLERSAVDTLGLFFVSFPCVLFSFSSLHFSFIEWVVFVCFDGPGCDGTTLLQRKIRRILKLHEFNS